MWFSLIDTVYCVEVIEFEQGMGQSQNSDACILAVHMYIIAVGIGLVLLASATSRFSSLYKAYLVPLCSVAHWLIRASDWQSEGPGFNTHAAGLRIRDHV